MTKALAAYVLIGAILASCVFDAVTASSALFIPGAVAFLALVALTVTQRRLRSGR